MSEQKVELGKVVTILFNSPYSKPLKIAISKEGYYKKDDVISISPKSPLALAILNRKIGESIKFQTPEEKIKVKIIDVA